MDYKDILTQFEFGNAPAKYIEEVGHDTLLRYYKPVWDCIDIQQNIHHNESVYEHLLLTLEAICKKTVNPLLRLAALFHDVGKPATLTEDDKLGCHFYKHEIVGATITYKWMKQWKFPQQDIQYVIWCLRNHMWRLDSNCKLKVVRRWLREMGPNWRDLITLRLADRQGNLANKGRPLITQNMASHLEKIELVLHGKLPVFDIDLQTNKGVLLELGVPPEKLDEAIEGCWSCVLKNCEYNTHTWLDQYVRKHYVTKKET